MNFDLRKLLVLLAAVAALVAGGCGGDDDESSDGGEPLSADAYETEIQGILQTFGEESVAIGGELQSATSADDLAAGVGELDTLTQTAVDDLNAIEPPEDAADAHETLTTALEGYLEDTGSLVEVVDSGDDQAIQAAGVEFQEAAVEVQSDIAEALQQLEDAGIEPPSAP